MSIKITDFSKEHHQEYTEEHILFDSSDDYLTVTSTSNDIDIHSPALHVPFTLVQMRNIDNLINALEYIKEKHTK